MKSLRFTVYALLIGLFATTAFGGGTDHAGNGGGGVVCRDSTGSIIGIPSVPTGAKLLDLWEAETLPQKTNGGKPLVLAPSSGVWQEQVATIVDKIKNVYPDYASFLQRELDLVKPDFESPHHILPVKQKIVADSSDFATPERCFREQIVTYTKDYGAIVSQSIWERLDETHRAALVLHEAIYKLNRDLYNAPSSDSTQAIIGLLFSTSPLTREILGAVPTPEDLQKPLIRISIEGGEASKAGTMWIDGESYSYPASSSLRLPPGMHALRWDWQSPPVAGYVVIHGPVGRLGVYDTGDHVFVVPDFNPR